jgi:hypothetical protein
MKRTKTIEEKLEMELIEFSENRIHFQEWLQLAQFNL